MYEMISISNGMKLYLTGFVIKDPFFPSLMPV